jgi:molecular chaperone GrpE
MSDTPKEPPKGPESDQAGPAPAGSSDSTASDAAATAADAPSVVASAEGAAASDIVIEVEPQAPSEADRVAELEAKAKDSHDRHLRALADLENYKKRVRKEVDDARTEAQGKVLREMLPVVDNLERALAHAEKQEVDIGGIIEGVRLVLRQFGQAFERCGVTAIDAQGKPFDPNVHEAVSQAESADVPPGTVVEVLQTGYKIGERLLRPTLAVVSRAPSAPPPSEPTPESGGADASGGAEA